MSTSAIAWLFALLMLVIIGLALLRIYPPHRPSLIYSIRPVLTVPEQELFRRLVAALPECMILPQVSLSSIIVGQPGNRIALNKISQKSVDFAICLEDFKTIAVVELDDASHKRA